MIEMSLTSPKFLESQFRFLMRDPVRAMKVLLIVASADGMISESEKMLVTEFANRLEIDDARFQTLLRSAARGRTVSRVMAKQQTARSRMHGSFRIPQASTSAAQDQGAKP